MPRLTYAALANPRRGNAALVACLLVALGVVGLEFFAPDWLPHPSFIARHAAYRPLYYRPVPNSPIYPGEVVRIIDGDTFVARLRLPSGREVETHVRLRRIDAAELHARCARELRLALAAKAALQRLLADGAITLSHVGPDKYPERVDADVATHNIADISAAMLNGGYARPYDGGRRGTWCG